MWRLAAPSPRACSMSRLLMRFLTASSAPLGASAAMPERARQRRAAPSLPRQPSEVLAIHCAVGPYRWRRRCRQSGPRGRMGQSSSSTESAAWAVGPTEVPVQRHVERSNGRICNLNMMRYSAIDCRRRSLKRVGSCHARGPRRRMVCRNMISDRDIWAAANEVIKWLNARSR